jgi:histidinol-phosphate aminotransferase
MRQVPLDRHPDPEASALRQLLAEVNDVALEEVLVGNGSLELIYALAIAYLRPADRAVVVGPTFGEYAKAAAMMGAEVVAWRAEAEPFELDVAALVHWLRDVRPRVVFLCNPNNPTGHCIDDDAIRLVAESNHDALLVLDEAFVRFARPQWPHRNRALPANVVIVRSMTKDYALTGLRLGYALGSASVIAALEKVQPPWSVNALAQAAGMAALRDEEHIRSSLAAIAREREPLMADIARLGLAVVPSSVHFFLVRVPSAKECAAGLLRLNVAVRDGTSFGLQSHVRIATRRPEENHELVQKLAALHRLSSQR